MVPRRRILIAPLALVLTFAFGASADAASKPPKITSVKPLKVEVGQKLTVTGRYFRSGKRKNILVFKRDGKPAVFVKVTASASTRKLVVTVPTKLLPFLKEGEKVSVRRFRLRVLSRRFGERYTSTKLSPQVGVPGSLGGTPAPAVIADCDGDKVPNDVDDDDDNDKLSDVAEAGLKTDPCKFDTDGDGVSDAYEVESALDLNVRALPYPGKRPFPNALDGTDGSTDYDGDGLALVEEYMLWLHTTGGNFPLTYSDGDQDTNPAGANTPALGSPLDMSGDGLLSDDEKDADGDAMGNWDESHGRLSPGWWAAAFENEKPFHGAPGNQVMTPLNFVDPDVDGDSVLDGYDDQDHDGWPNVDERSRGKLLAQAQPAYAGQTLPGQYIAVNPYNPCLPDPNSRTCSLHPPFQDPWAPFDGSLDWTHPPFILTNAVGGP